MEVLRKQKNTLVELICRSGGVMDAKEYFGQVDM